MTDGQYLLFKYTGSGFDEKVITAVVNKLLGFDSDLNPVMTDAGVPYVGALADVNLGLHSFLVDTTTLSVDATTHKVGIKILVPETDLHVNGNFFIKGGSGDINNANGVSALDSLYAQYHVGDAIVLSPAQYGRADIFGSGIIYGSTPLFIQYLTANLDLLVDNGVKLKAALGRTAFPMPPANWDGINFQVLDYCIGWNVATNSAIITVTPTGKVGLLGVRLPTAMLHLPAGTATAGSAPMKFNAGTDLLTPEAGAVEWTGLRMRLTQNGAIRKDVAYTTDFFGLEPEPIGNFVNPLVLTVNTELTTLQVLTYDSYYAFAKQDWHFVEIDGVSADNVFKLPLIAEGTYDFYVDYGDGTEPLYVNTYNHANATHTYEVAGIYTIKLGGTVVGIGWESTNKDQTKLIKISNWGTCSIANSNGRQFMGCQNLTMAFANTKPTSTYIITKIPSGLGTLLNNTFFGCWYLDYNFANWNISNVTNVHGMFQNCYSFKGLGLETWDFSSITVNPLVFCYGTPIPTNYYDAILIHMATLSLSNLDGFTITFMITGGTQTTKESYCKYSSSAASARALLLSESGLIIEDEGFDSITGLNIGITDWDIDNEAQLFVKDTITGFVITSECLFALDIENYLFLNTFNGLVHKLVTNYNTSIITVTHTNSGISGTITISDPNLPSITNVRIDYVNSYSVGFQFYLDSKGLSTNYWIEYGLDDTYGLTFAGYNPISNATTIDEFVPDLTSLTTYHYRIKATNSSGTVYSADNTFTTL